MISRTEWFSISAEGLSEHYKKTYMIRELLANSFDEDNQLIVVNISLNNATNEYIINIIDDDKDGFDNLEDMFTLFRKTKKIDDTSVRGRFNHGEKGVLSLCNHAILKSTKGTVIFQPDGKRIIDTSVKTKRGSDLSFYIDLTKDEYTYLMNYIQFVKIPKGMKVQYNGTLYEYEKPKKVIEITLQTWKSQQTKAYYKNTEVFIYPLIDNNAYLMELGIPIQKIKYPFTIDVRQKIPLDTKRNAVKSTYLEDLFGQLANHKFFLDSLNEENIAEDYVTIAMSSEHIEPKSAKKLVEMKMGSDKLIIANPFDQKANEKAVENGYTLIHSRDIPKSTREAIKTTGIQTTSDIFKENTENANIIPKSAYSMGMKWIENVSIQFAKFSIQKTIRIQFNNNPNCSELASYGTQTLSYNLGRLGMNFFDMKENIAQISELLIHELAHDLKEREDLPHLSRQYIDEIQRIAGKLVLWLMQEPNYVLFKDFFQ